MHTVYHTSTQIILCVWFFKFITNILKLAVFSKGSRFNTTAIHTVQFKGGDGDSEYH